MIVRYLTHPQVMIDPDVPVMKWGLNELGASRVTRLIKSDRLSGTTYVVSSGEQKALDTARPIAAAIGCELDVRARTHENDRSATGYLPGPEFEATADAFFAEPDVSVRGWEKAVDAQSRIVGEVEEVLVGPVGGDVLIVGHGAVGTLLYCHLAGLPISRQYDQTGGGGGCLFSFHINTRVPHSHWQTIEEFIA